MIYFLLFYRSYSGKLFLLKSSVISENTQLARITPSPCSVVRAHRKNKNKTKQKTKQNKTKQNKKQNKKLIIEARNGQIRSRKEGVRGPMSQGVCWC